MKFGNFLTSVVIFLFFFITFSSCQTYHKSLKRLSFYEGIDYYPTWTPDGKFLVYTSDEGMTHLCKVSVSGGKPLSLTSFPSNHSRVSPKGDYIAFDSNRGEDAMLIPLQGGKAVKISPDSIKSRGGAFCFWSKDGLKVYFSTVQGVMEKEIKTGLIRNVFFEDGFHTRGFSISEDGKFMTADVTKNGTTESDIWLLDLLAGKYEIMTNLPGREGNPVFSPDEKMIAFMSTNGDKRELRIMNVKTKKNIVVSPHEGFNANPRWSPDGTKMAFSSDIKGNVDIWVMDLDIKKIRKDLEID